MDLLQFPQEPLLKHQHLDQKVSFRYSTNWPIYTDFGQRGVIGPSGQFANPEFPFALFPIKSYETPYDVSFPVWIEIYDGTALNNKGYSFNFLVEVNIRDNTIFNQSMPRLRTYSIGSAQFCQYNQRDSGNISFEIEDLQGNPVNNAMVTFASGSYSCLLGSASEVEGKTEFDQPFPVGLGTLMISAQGYLPFSMPYGTIEGESENLGEIQLVKLVEKPVTIKKKCYVKNPSFALTGPYSAISKIKSGEYDAEDYWSFNSQPKDLDADEYAILTISKIKEDELEEDFTRSVIIYGGAQEEETLEIAPGEYEVSIVLIKDKTVIIPECEDCICTDRSIIRGCTDWDNLEEVKFEDKFFKGSLDSMEMRLTQNNIYADNTMVFYAPCFDLDNVPPDRRFMYDLEVFTLLENRTLEHPDEFKVRYK